MWHHYLPNQLYKRIVLVFLGLFILSNNSWGQEENVLAPLGVVESIEEIIKIQRSKFDQVHISSKQNEKKLITNLKSENVYLNPNFLQSIFLFSPKKYVNLIKENECHFYALLMSGLLKTSKGKINKVVIDLVDNNRQELASISLEDYINLKTKNKCQNTTEIAKIFKPNNIRSTIKKISFPTPKTESECHQIQNDWKKNDYLPFLCGIKEDINFGRRVEKLKRSSKNNLSVQKISQYNKVIKDFNTIFGSTTLYQRSYLSSLCNHLDSPANYCSLYLSSLVWDKIINAEKPKYYLDRICEDILPNQKITPAVAKLCRNKLVSNDKICQNPSSKRFSQFFPHQTCNKISDSLNNARLFTDYPDCPATIDNESITNYHRLYEHFKKNKSNYEQTKCEHIPINNFAKINIEYQNEQAWPLKLCYFDKFEDKKVCKTYIPGSNRDEPLSEVNMVSQIINKQLSLRSDADCKLVTKDEYKPQFLKFKNGCFIVRDTDNCTLLNCKKKIFIDLKEINLISYSGTPSVDHFPSSFSNSKFSQDKVLKETLKLSSRRLLNLTMLKNYFDYKDKRIAHGVGCLEDLMPRSFKREVLQQCTPHPFIIDGIIEKNSNTYLVFRSSIEKVHFPRQLRWQNIFNAISNYKEIHPLKTWALFGVNHEKN